MVFKTQEIFRSTGIPELDKAIKMQLAPKIAIQLSTVVSLPFFKKLDVHNETIWCHAASVGEFNTLETLIPDLKKHFKTHEILLTVVPNITDQRPLTFGRSAMY